MPPSTPQRRAVIDIGTNSVKLLVADLHPHSVEPVLEIGQQTRLGQGFYQTHTLQPEPIARTAQAIAAFAHQARALGALSVRAVATSAARDARNPNDLLQAVYQAAQLPVDIISGEQEADRAFRGVLTDPTLHQHPLLILDVGGGSTEIIIGQDSQQHFRHSFHLGTVRLLEHLRPPDPPTPDHWRQCREWLHSFLANTINPHLGPWSPHHCPTPPLLVGTGGTTSILASLSLGLASFDRPRIEGASLPCNQIQQLRAQLWGLPLALRRALPGLPPERADVILTGIAIYEAVMEFFRLPSLRVSTRGLRFGLLLPPP